MKHSLRIVIALAMLALLTTGLFAAGGQEGTSTGDKLTITMRPWTARGTTLEPDSWAELYMEEYFDVNIEPWYGIDGYDSEATNVRFASGDIPDFIGGFSDSYVDLGIVRELPQDMIRQNMPGYMKWADYYLGDEVWRRTVIDNVNYAVPTGLSMASTGLVMGIRADWLRAVGFDPEPVEGTSFFKGPDTLEELEEVLLKFRNEDPDGDGKKDTYGYMVWKNNASFTTNFLPNIFGAFGIQQSVWEVRDGEGYYSAVDPNYRRALKYINSWWEKEIIHPDTVTNVRADVLRAMSNDEFGAWSDFDAWQSNYKAGPWGAYLEKHPDGGIAYTITPAGPDGTRGTWYRDPNWTPWCIGINASDEVTAKIMEMTEVMFTDKQVYAELFYGGEQGDLWDWDESGYAVPIQGQAAKDSKEATALGVRMWIGHIPHIVPPIDKVYIQPERYELQNYLEQNQVKYPGYGFRPTFDENERVLESNISGIQQEYAWNAVTGQVDIDATWDEYVDRMMDAGLAQLLETVKSQE